MEKKFEILDNFKVAISSTIKSLSNSENIEVFFGVQTSKSDKNSIKLPEIEHYNNEFNYDQIRALADSESLKIRYSDIKIYKKYEPEGNISKKLYEIAEKIRFEKIGTDKFKGVKNNIEKYYQKRVNSLDLKSSEDRIVESFENYLRVKFLKFKNSKNLDKKLKTYKKDLDEKFKGKIDKLNNFLDDQASFNSIISELISNMSLDEEIEDQDKERNEENKEEKPKDSDNTEQRTKEQEQQEMSIETGAPELESEAKDSDQDGKEVEIEDKSKSELRKNTKNNISGLKYKSYTNEFDEIIKAEELENEEE